MTLPPERTTRTRVAVTGMGVKTPVGSDLTAFWSGLVAGAPAAAPITSFDASDLPVRFACEVRDFDPLPYLGRKESSRVDRVTQLGFAAAADAVADAGELRNDPMRCAVVVGTGVGAVSSMYEHYQILVKEGLDRISPLVIPMIMPNATTAMIGIRFGWTGPSLCISTACSSGAHAIGEGARLIQENAAEVVLAGGTEAVVTPIAISAFARMGALSTRNDQPDRASRPFDVDRDGFVLGEGAAFLVLESWERAVGRGVRVYGEISGYGRNSDAHHMAAPSPGGVGAVACMRLALADANLEPSDIGHISAHGTSTLQGDAAEGQAIQAVFGPASPPVTSIKGATGHLIGASGAAEAVAALLALRDRVAPPTANLESLDPDIRIDLICGAPRAITNRPVLSNSFGFGGHNAALVLSGP